MWQRYPWNFQSLCWELPGFGYCGFNLRFEFPHVWRLWEFCWKSWNLNLNDEIDVIDNVINFVMLLVSLDCWNIAIKLRLTTYFPIFWGNQNSNTCDLVDDLNGKDRFYTEIFRTVYAVVYRIQKSVPNHDTDRSRETKTNRTCRRWKFQQNKFKLEEKHHDELQENSHTAFHQSISGHTRRQQVLEAVFSE